MDDSGALTAPSRLRNRLPCISSARHMTYTKILCPKSSRHRSGRARIGVLCVGKASLLLCPGSSTNSVRLCRLRVDSLTLMRHTRSTPLHYGRHRWCGQVLLESSQAVDSYETCSGPLAWSGERRNVTVTSSTKHGQSVSRGLSCRL